MIKYWWYHASDGKGGVKRYLCNGACNVTEEKLAKTKDEVTCKNCLNLLNKKD